MSTACGGAGRSGETNQAETVMLAGNPAERGLEN